ALYLSGAIIKTTFKGRSVSGWVDPFYGLALLRNIPVGLAQLDSFAIWHLYRSRSNGHIAEHNTAPVL
ncbi:MAG: hypothetical protein V3U36_04130, partial [Anaerolineales bacterium]